MKIFKIIIPVFALFILYGCSEDSTNEVKVKETDLLEDSLVSEVEIKTFVQKVYIDLIGRKPTTIEFDAGVKTLMDAEASAISREQFVQSLMGSDEYYNKVYNYAKSEYLNGIDEQSLVREKFKQANILQLAIQTNNKVLEELTLRNLKNLDSLIVVPERLRAKVFGEQEMHKRVVMNTIYDDINMGVPNFTFSIFESFLFREPTIEEWETSRNICNSVGGVLFGINAQSKSEFVDVVFSSDHYFEGRVISSFRRFLNRVPNTNELKSYTLQIATSKKFDELYLEILSSNEYFKK